MPGFTRIPTAEPGATPPEPLELRQQVDVDVDAGRAARASRSASDTFVPV